MPTATRSPSFSSTTHGIGLIAEGFPWRPGDNVVTAEDEYPSNLYPWMNLESRGVSLRQVESREGRIWIDDLAAAMDRSTRVLAISHVEFATGFRNDLDGWASSARTAALLFFVDAIQGLGPLTIDVTKDPDRFPGRRRPQVAARARGGGHPVRAPRLARTAAGDRRRLAQRRRLVQLARESSSS